MPMNIERFTDKKVGDGNCFTGINKEYSDIYLKNHCFPVR